MSVIIILVIVGIVVAGLFLLGFIWAVKSGQYDDMYSPSVRILFDNNINEDTVSSSDKPKGETKNETDHTNSIKNQ